MKIAALTAEFNPFHNGHGALCAAVREEGATHVVAVMSGNFVQRGDLAVTEKRIRAACAIRSGVDLVLELPLPWAMATAQTFARGGVGLMAASRCVDILCFGSECGDRKLLGQAADAVDHPRVEERLRELLGSGITYAKARELAVKAVFGEEVSGPLSSPNDLLGVEYLRQAAALGWEPEVFVLGRKGVAHHGERPVGKYASASYLRAQGEKLSRLTSYLPPAAGEILRAAKADGLYPIRREKLETAILAGLRGLPGEALTRLPDLSEGLENRFYAAIRSASTLAELEASLKTKRYTMARVRRLILSAFLGIEKGDCAGLPPYLRVLGMGEKGREVLSRMGQRASLPTGTSLAKLARLDESCGRIAALEARATDLYTLAAPRPLPCGWDMTAKVSLL